MPLKHHSNLIRRGLRWHERRQYERALPLFVDALKQCPTCPNAKYNLANTLHAWAGAIDDPALYEQAIAAFRSALEIRTLDGNPLGFAQIQNNMGNALQALGELNEGARYQAEAIDA